MNQNPGILGRKIGMTQVVTADGSMVPCTVVQAGSVVVGKRSKEKNGYDALILGFGDLLPRHTSKPVAGQYKDGKATPKRDVREFRCDAALVAKYEVGQEVKIEELFSEGQFVDVRATSRGRGFTGVMRRHNFAGAKASHGVHEYKRHGGSIGTNMTPGRVKPGVGMAGQHGNKVISVLNQPIVKVLADKQLLLIRGGIPGSKNRVVEVRGAVKKRNAGVVAASG
jgi:large subunit ribosomal protein L3